LVFERNVERLGFDISSVEGIATGALASAFGDAVVPAAVGKLYKF
jgi:hypothetical protein